MFICACMLYMRMYMYVHDVYVHVHVYVYAGIHLRTALLVSKQILLFAQMINSSDQPFPESKNSDRTRPTWVNIIIIYCVTTETQHRLAC